MSSDCPPGTIDSDSDLRARFARAEQLVREEGHHPLASELTLGLLHKLNNLMTGVYLNLESAEEALDPAHPASRSLRAVAETIQQSQTLVRRTADLNLPPDGERGYHDIGALIQEHWELLKIILPKGAVAEFTPPPQPLYVLVSSEEFREALFQLALITRGVASDGRARVDVRAISADGLDLTLFQPALENVPGGVAILYADFADAAPGAGGNVSFLAYQPERGGSMNRLYRAQELVRRQGGAMGARQTPGGAEFVILLPAVH